MEPVPIWALAGTAAATARERAARVSKPCFTLQVLLAQSLGPARPSQSLFVGARRANSGAPGSRRRFPPCRPQTGNRYSPRSIRTRSDPDLQPWEESGEGTNGGGGVQVFGVRCSVFGSTKTGGLYRRPSRNAASRAWPLPDGEGI